MNIDLTTPRYSQPEVLRVTRLKPAVLQTWMNRQVIELTEQNPGYGKRRLYSALDVVKLAVMRRIADLRIDLSIAKEIAGEAERMLVERGEVPWSLHIQFKPEDATKKESNITIAASAGYSLLSLKYGAIQGDAWGMNVARFTEPFESVFQRRERTGSDERPIDPVRRDFFARQGIHAEPAVIYPLGEIVNGTLAQLAAMHSIEVPETLD